MADKVFGQANKDLGALIGSAGEYRHHLVVVDHRLEEVAAPAVGAQAAVSIAAQQVPVHSGWTAAVLTATDYTEMVLEVS